MRISQRVQVGEEFSPFKQFNGIHIPEAIFYMRSLSHAAKLLYGRLARYAGEKKEAWPSYATLAKEFDVSERHAIRLVKELVDARLIEVRRRTKDSGEQDSNLFVFLWHEAFEPTAPDQPTGGEKVDLAEEDKSVMTKMSDRFVTQKRVSSKRVSSEENQSEQQQQQQSAAPQREPAPPAAADGFQYEELFQLLLPWFPDDLTRTNKTFREDCDPSGCSCAQLVQVIREAGDEIFREAKTPRLVVQRAIRRLQRRTREVPERQRDAAGDDSPYTPAMSAVAALAYTDHRVIRGEPCARCGKELFAAAKCPDGEPATLFCHCDSSTLPAPVIRTRDRLEAMRAKGLSWEDIRASEPGSQQARATS